MQLPAVTDDSPEAGEGHVGCSEQGTFLRGKWKQTPAHFGRRCRIGLEGNANIGADGVKRRVEQRVTDDQRAFTVVGENPLIGLCGI